MDEHPTDALPRFAPFLQALRRYRELMDRIGFRGGLEFDLLYTIWGRLFLAIQWEGGRRPTQIGHEDGSGFRRLLESRLSAHERLEFADLEQDGLRQAAAAMFDGIAPRDALQAYLQLAIRAPAEGEPDAVINMLTGQTERLPVDEAERRLQGIARAIRRNGGFLRVPEPGAAWIVPLAFDDPLRALWLFDRKAGGLLITTSPEKDLARRDCRLIVEAGRALLGLEEILAEDIAIRPASDRSFF